jgi:hypothetical protein
VGAKTVLKYFIIIAGLCMAFAVQRPAFAQQQATVWQDADVAILQGLDKITAKIQRFTAPVGQSVSFGRLRIKVQGCRKTPPEEKPESAAFLEIDDKTVKEGTRRVFTGWMFASTPALSALEHPVYDINLLECTGDVQ